MRNLTKTFLGFSILVILAACPKNKSNDVVNQTVNGYQNCSNCGGLVNGQEFLSTESQDLNNLFTLRLGFGGSSTSGGGFGYNPSQYSGPVAASRGELVVLQTHYQGYCLIPAGTYSVGTISTGQYSSGIISNLRLLASGPVSLEIAMNSAQISSFANRDYNSMALINQRLFSFSTSIESMNGQYCRSSMTAITLR
jgi:hypothetical protein